MADIPLKEAQVIWDYEGADDSLPPVKVMRAGTPDNPDYLAAWGACNADFQETDDDGRVRMLFQQFHELVTPQ